MRTSDFEYDLPPELVAQTPLEPRDASRLLVLHRPDGRLEHRLFHDLAAYLCPGDLLVANESRVIPARLFGHKIPSGGKVEILLLTRQDECTWEVLLKPGRRVHPGTQIAIQPAHDGPGAQTDNGPVVAEVVGVTEAGGRVIRFPAPIEPLLDRIGVLPLPPYIHTPLLQPERYQTVYARVRGSVAAPTAGLHFTDQLMQRLQADGVEFAFVTLHVSMDTFRPVQEETLEEHRMYSESFVLPAETAAAINRARGEGRRVIAVGTTTVRVLETVARQMACDDPTLRPLAGQSDLFIRAGFSFRVVDALITNFHLPRSTLLMLVAAFVGKESMDRAYAEAVRERYRFYSFGDAMLIL